VTHDGVEATPRPLTIPSHPARAGDLRSHRAALVDAHSTEGALRAHQSTKSYAIAQIVYRRIWLEIPGGRGERQTRDLELQICRRCKDIPRPLRRARTRPSMGHPRVALRSKDLPCASGKHGLRPISSQGVCRAPARRSFALTNYEAGRATLTDPSAAWHCRANRLWHVTCYAFVRTSPQLGLCASRSTRSPRGRLGTCERRHHV
jgi:hypothetical protein